MADTTELEALSLDELQARYDALLDELFYLECPPDEREARELALREQAFDYHLEMERRKRYGLPDPPAPDKLVLRDGETTVRVEGSTAGVLVHIDDNEKERTLWLSIDEAADFVARLVRGIEQAHAAKRETMVAEAG